MTSCAYVRSAPALMGASPTANWSGPTLQPQQIGWPVQLTAHARGEKSLAAAVVRVLRGNSGSDERGARIWRTGFVVVLETPPQDRIHRESEFKWLEIAAFAPRTVLTRSCRVSFIYTAARKCLCLARRSIHLLRAASWSPQSWTTSIVDGERRRRAATALPNERALRRCRATRRSTRHRMTPLALLLQWTRTWLACSGSPWADGLRTTPL